MAVSNLVSSSLNSSDLISAPTWTLVGSYTTSSGSSYTWSNLTGYNRYRVVFQNFRWNSDSNIEVRINGVTTDSYWQQGFTGSLATAYTQNTATSFYCGYYKFDYGVPSYGWLDINNAGQAGSKTGELFMNTATSGSAADRRRTVLGFSLGGNTAAITSITVFNAISATFNFSNDYPNAGIHLYGAK